MYFKWCILKFIKNCKGMEVGIEFDSSDEENKASSYGSVIDCTQVHQIMEIKVMPKENYSI